MASLASRARYHGVKVLVTSQAFQVSEKTYTTIQIGEKPRTSLMEASGNLKKLSRRYSGSKAGLMKLLFKAL